MSECESCGASVKAGERECPYCGYSFMDRVTAPKPEIKDPRIYSVDRKSGTIHFGDGERGARPTTGKDNVSASYRHGAGATGKIVCIQCKHENQPTSMRCEACGAELQRRILHRRRENP